MSIGENVKRIRKEQRYTQTEIARRCGVTPAAISAIEHGVSAPSTPLLARLAKALDVSADELLREPTPGKVSARPKPGRLLKENVHDAVATTDEVSARLIEELAHIVDAWRAGLMSEDEAVREVRELVTK